MKRFRDDWFEIVKKPHTAVRCNSEEEAREFLSMLEEKKVFWLSGDKATDYFYLMYDYISKNVQKICYVCSLDERGNKYLLSYAGMPYLKDAGYNIVCVKDLIECRSYWEAYKECTYGITCGLEQMLDYNEYFCCKEFCEGCGIAFEPVDCVKTSCVECWLRKIKETDGQKCKS